MKSKKKGTRGRKAPRKARSKPPARGGARAGAGRPAAGSIPWADVERYADAGAPETEIVTALGITEVALQDRGAAERFRSLLARGHARYRLALREQIKTRGSRTTRSSGAVNALALQARNHLDWDRHLVEQQLPPDLAGARERLRDTFARLAAARTEIEGRKVTPSELLHREALTAEASAAGRSDGP